MTFDVVFLGTGAAVPVPSRGTTSQFLDIHSHTYLIDAGEGVQLALRKNDRRFQKLRGVFISHMHGDHVLGLPGLLSTMSLLGRKETLDVWGPPELEAWMSATWKAIEAHKTFDIRFKTWSDSEPLILLETEKYRLVSIPVKHRIPCCGLKVEEHSLPWKLEGKKAGEARLPYHVRQSLKRGESVEFEGQILDPAKWCAPPPAARSYVYSADTRPCASLLKAAQGASVLYHDATFNAEDHQRAKSTFHSTTVEAARLARQAGVGTLLLGHISLRYRDLEVLRNEALQEHTRVEVARDGMVWRVMSS
ncbi:MAG: ribonuclease Z [Bacteroidetes bacterium]|nr:ribonuclease Z [Bacteroidota bacterium]